MARRKAADHVFDGNTDDLIESLKEMTGYIQQSEKKIPCYGIDVDIALGYVLGGTSVLPLARKLEVSGPFKSGKSIFCVDLGNRAVEQGGIHITIDTEGKTSSTMHDAMTWMHRSELVRSGKRRLYKPVRSIEGWQDATSKLMEMARQTATRPKGERIPIAAFVDSASNVTSEDAMNDIAKEGHAAARQFPVAAMQTSNFMPAIRLEGTTSVLGFVHHVREQMDGRGETEKGAAAVHYNSSILLRLKRVGTLRMASHSGAPASGPPIEGSTINVKHVYGCLGPDNRNLLVDLLWQYIEDPETGAPRQVMWMDWDGALGRMLRDMKYGEKSKLFEYEKTRLNETLFFTQPRTNIIKCDELGLDSVSLTEFGKAISDNVEIADRIRKYLGIVHYPNVQDVDEFE